MAEVRLLCGPQRSGRLRAMDDLMRRHWDRALFLVPTRQLAERRLERLILDSDLKGAWGPRVQTFDDFVRGLLESGHADATPIDDFERALLLQDAIARVHADGGLDALGSAADSAGFHSHMQRLIAQLKQAAVDPEDFRRRTARRPHATALDAVVAEVYGAYQAMLIEAKLYDRQGVFWEATELCRRRRPEALRDVLLLDGFDDFTPSEFRLLETLEPSLEQLVFGLNYDIDPDRRDLYRLTADTAGRIQARFSPQVETFHPAPPESFTKFASAKLFWRDRPACPTELRADLEVQPCPGAVAEIEHVGRRIKTLLLEGVSLEEVAVIFRDLEGIAGTVRGVFAEFGIPVRVVRRPSLAESAVCGFLLDFLDAVEHWGRELVVEVLTSPWFRPPERPESPHADAFPSLSRLAQIVAGHREWDGRLAALVRHLQTLDRDESAGIDDPEQADAGRMRRYVRHMPEAPAAAQALFDRFQDMTAIATGLPRSAGMCGHIAALEKLIGACGVEEAVRLHPVPAVRATESGALARLRGLLALIYDWCEVDDDEEAPLERSEFALRLRKALRDTTYDPHDPPRGVACLDAEAARGMRFDHVFLCGANEGAFPRPGSANAVYSDEDLDELERLGIPLDGRQGRADREALLFHRVLDVPRRRLVITYRTLSSEGREMRVSPYVEDVLELFPPEAGVLRPAIPAAAFVPPPEEVASRRDLRNSACSTGPGLRKLFPDALRPVERGIAIEGRRQGFGPLDAYDGVVADSALRDRLADLFGEEHRFSVSQVERYVICPFRYYSERVLAVLDIEPPSEEFTTGIMGTVLHEVLQAFHHHYRGRAVAELPPEEARTALETLSEEVFRRQLRRSMSVSAGVAAVEKRRIDAILARYLRHSCKEEDLRWKPAHFEVTFGESREEFHDPLDRADPLSVETAEGTVRFKGRIDRIDRDGDRVRVVDYKSGPPPAKSAIGDGTSLQLPLYAVAVEEFLLREASCEGAYFLHLGRDVWVEGMDRGAKKDGWPERREVALRTVARAVRGIRQGEFPPVPKRDACRYCAVARACRYDAARIDRKRPEGNGEADT